MGANGAGFDANGASPATEYSTLLASTCPTNAADETSALAAQNLRQAQTLDRIQLEGGWKAERRPFRPRGPIFVR